MKSKIIPIILCICIVVLGGIIVFLGINQNKERKNTSELANKIEELTKDIEEKGKSIEEKDKIISEIKDVLDKNNSENQNNDLSNFGTVKTYYNDDESVMLMLIECKNRDFQLAKGNTKDGQCFFIYNELFKEGIGSEYMGRYNISDGKITFFVYSRENPFYMGKLSLQSEWNADGSQKLTVDYDENSDTLILGKITLKLKK